DGDLSLKGAGVDLQAELVDDGLHDGPGDGDLSIRGAELLRGSQLIQIGIGGGQRLAHEDLRRAVIASLSGKTRRQGAKACQGDDEDDEPVSGAQDAQL